MRTEEGTDPDPAIKLQQTISKIAGDSLNGTGMWAFLKSAQKLGFTPRILVAPGYTIADGEWCWPIERTTPGAGYVMDHLYPVEFTGGGPDVVRRNRPRLRAERRCSLVPVSLNCPALGTNAPTIKPRLRATR